MSISDLAVPGALLLLWGLLSFAGPVYSRVRRAVSEAWAGSPTNGVTKARPQPLDAAAHFFHLRKHFRDTGQGGRVSVMDDRLAAGVFAEEKDDATDVAWAKLKIAEETRAPDADD